VESIKKEFKINPREIAYLRFILEGYDGLAVLTTLDSKAGIVSLHISPERVEEVDEIIQGLSKEIAIEPARPGE